MKKGMCIGSVLGDTLFEKMDCAKKAGFDGAELSITVGSQLDFTSTDSDIEKVKSYAKEIGLELYSLSDSTCWLYSLTSPDSENRETAKAHIIRQLEMANMLECDTILALPGIVGCDFLPGFEPVDYAEAYERALEAVGELAPYAEKYGVNLAFENVHNKLLNSPVEFKDFLDKIGSKYVNCYFDVGNVMMFGYPEHWIRCLKDKIKKVHFKDYQIATHNFVDLLEGDVNYPEVMKALAEIGYDDWVTAELPPTKYYKNSTLYTSSVAMDIILGKIEL